MSIYDYDTYLKSIAYSKDQAVLTFSTASTRHLYSFFLLTFNVPSLLISRFINNGQNNVLANIYTALILGCGFIVIELLNSTVSTYAIEDKYGFNRLKVNRFILGWFLKLLSAIVILILVITTLEAKSGALGLITAFIIFISLLIYKKLKFKLIPLDNIPITEKISVFAKEQNFKIYNVYKYNTSALTTRANAFFYQDGRKRKIVFYDTVIEHFDDSEILAIFAHEMAHAKHKDPLKSLLIIVPIICISLLAIYFTYISNGIFEIFGHGKPNAILTAIIFLGSIGLLSSILKCIYYPLSRHLEYQADRFAAKNSSGDSMIAALKRIATHNLMNIYPHYFDELINYSHPNILNRIRSIDKCT